MQKPSPGQQQLLELLQAWVAREGHPPTIREMMHALQLRSPAPIQQRLAGLKKKGYIDWEPGQARTLRIINRGIPVYGAIAAGGLMEAFTDAVERLDLGALFSDPQIYGLRVNGDSMVGAQIADGDLAVLRKVSEPDRIKAGTIVAACIPGFGTTLKYLKRQRDLLVFEAANPAYAPIEVPASQAEIQGELVGVWRDF